MKELDWANLPFGYCLLYTSAVDELHASSFLYPFYIGSTGQLGASVLFQPSAGRVGAGGAPCAVCRQDGGLALSLIHISFLHFRVTGYNQVDWKLLVQYYD